MIYRPLLAPWNILTYVKNKFDDNAKESDLKRILTLIEDDEEDIQV